MQRKRGGVGSKRAEFERLQRRNMKRREAVEFRMRAAAIITTATIEAFAARVREVGISTEEFAKNITKFARRADGLFATDRRIRVEF